MGSQDPNPLPRWLRGISAFLCADKVQDQPQRRRRVRAASGESEGGDSEEIWGIAKVFEGESESPNWVAERKKSWDNQTEIFCGRRRSPSESWVQNPILAQMAELWEGRGDFPAGRGENRDEEEDLGG